MGELKVGGKFVLLSTEAIGYQGIFNYGYC